MRDAKIIKNKGTNKICPNVQLENDMIFQKLKGKWYEIYTSIPSKPIQCERFSFSLTLYGSLSIYRKYFDANGMEMKMMGIAAEAQRGEIAIFYPAFPSKVIF